MWIFGGVGLMEIVLLLVAVVVLSITSKGRRWRIGVLPCLLVAALAPGTDPLSMLVIATPLLGALIGGVFLAPTIRPGRAGQMGPATQ